MLNAASLHKSVPLSFFKTRRNNQEFEIYEYKNGIYQGDILDFKREGYGIYLWDDGQVYLGEWRDDQMEGIGVVFFGFGGYVYGRFQRNKVNGPGVLTFPNGDIYACANWEAGKLNDRCIKFNFEEKTWSHVRYLCTVHMDGQRDNDRIYAEFLRIKESILKRNEPAEFEYKEYFYTFPYTGFYKERNTGKNSVPPSRCIDFLTFDEDSWFFGLTTNGVPDGLGLLGSKTLISSRGVFKEGRLNGVGRASFPNGDIQDGIFLNGELHVGFVYKKEEGSYTYAAYQKGTIKNQLADGKGFPFNLLTVCKHNIYIANLSYYYKYTAIEVIYLKELGKQVLALYPSIKFQPKPKSPEKPRKEKETVKKSTYKETESRSEREREPIVDSPEKLPGKSEVEHLIPGEVDQRNQLHRKSLGKEREKFSEQTLPESPPNRELIRKCTFGDPSTPKKVSLPAKESQVQTNSKPSSNNPEKSGLDQLLTEKKPTNLEYSAFMKCQNYYNEQVEKIMQAYQDGLEIEPDDEKPIGDVRVSEMKLFEGPPSFGELPERGSMGGRNQDVFLLENRQKQDLRSEPVEDSALRKSDLSMNKNAIVIYYDEGAGTDGKGEINLNEFDCKYFNLFTKKLERPGLRVHDKVRVEGDY